jgi:cell shape-determining protein MreC
MKMNYLPRNRAKYSYARPLLGLLLIFALGAVIFYFLGGTLVSAISPLWRTENRVASSFSGVGNFFSSRQSLLSENALLRERVSSLELELASRSSGSEEENVLLNLLGRRSEDGGIAATALITPPQTPYDNLIIDAGEDDGVSLGMKVFLPEGPLLGLVSEVNSSTAHVKLFSTGGEKVSAVLERGNIPVALEGSGGGNFRIVVPRETVVEVGDRVLSADLAARLLAVVEDVNLKPTDSFKEVLASSPASVFNIRFVIVRP